jgi:hypothetical protein
MVLCRRPIRDRRMKPETDAKVPVREWLAINNSCMRVKAARGAIHARLLFRLPFSFGRYASAVRTDVLGDGLIRDGQVFGGYKADRDCHRNALFISTLEAHEP